MLPAMITENGNVRGITAGVIGSEEYVPEERRHVHKLEQIGGIKTDVDGDGNLIAGEILLRSLLEEDIFDRRGVTDCGKAGAVGEEQWPATILVVELDVNHAVVILIGIGVEEDAVDNAEDGGGGADAEH